MNVDPTPLLLINPRPPLSLSLNECQFRIATFPSCVCNALCLAFMSGLLEGILALYTISRRFIFIFFGDVLVAVVVLE